MPSNTAWHSATGTEKETQSPNIERYCGMVCSEENESPQSCSLWLRLLVCKRGLRVARQLEFVP